MAKKEIEIKETSYGWVTVDINDNDTPETIKEKVMEVVHGGNACFGDMEVELMSEVKNISSMTSSELFTEMTETQKDDIYRMVWEGHVAEDVESVLEEDRFDDLSDEDKEAIVEAVANHYVYDGDYDCNISYWDNIDALVDDEIQSNESGKISEEELLKRAVIDCGPDAVEEFLGHDLDSDAIDIWSEMNDAIANMPDDVYEEYLVQYGIKKAPVESEEILGTTLSKDQKDYILTYLDECNGGTFNDDVMTVIGADEIPDNLENSAQLLFWIMNKGIEAVENGVISYDALLGRDVEIN